MVSQPSIQRLIRSRFCLLGLLALGSFAAGCSQGEGGRCQIDSDCASGLVCKNEGGSNSATFGNGVCVPYGSLIGTGNDASTDSTSTVDASNSLDSEGTAVEDGGVDSGADMTTTTPVDAAAAAVDSAQSDATKAVDAVSTSDAPPPSHDATGYVDAMAPVDGAAVVTTDSATAVDADPGSSVVDAHPVD